VQEVLFLQIFNTLKRSQINEGKMFGRGNLLSQRCHICAGWRFHEEVASSKDSHGSKRPSILSIFVVLEILLKIKGPQ